VYDIVFTKQAHRSFQRIPHKIALRIRSKLEQLAADPYTQNQNVTKLQDRAGYRLRVGDWRVIYEIRTKQLIVLVLKIAHRGEVY